MTPLSPVSPVSPVAAGGLGSLMLDMLDMLTFQTWTFDLDAEGHAYWIASGTVFEFRCYDGCRAELGQEDSVLRFGLAERVAAMQSWGPLVLAVWRHGGAPQYEVRCGQIVRLTGVPNTRVRISGALFNPFGEGMEQQAALLRLAAQAPR